VWPNLRRRAAHEGEVPGCAPGRSVARHRRHRFRHRRVRRERVAGSAATNPYTAAGVCGSSYRELDHHSISGAVIYLMWNGADNCVATMKTSNIGKKTETEAILEVESPRGFYFDDDSYAYYAVIKEYAAGSCIKWGGMTSQIWESPIWDHCG
jgi:hypothetical protein